VIDRRSDRGTGVAEVTVMHRAIASIATVCLLTSGCSLTMKHPTRSSEIMDAGFVISSMIAMPAVRCHINGDQTDDGCFWSDAGAVLFGIPALVAFSIASSNAADEEGKNAMRLSGELPLTPTDTDTLQLAHQVEAQVRARQCVAARVTMNRIAERDAEYHVAMLAKGVLGTCATDGPSTAPSEHVAAPALAPPTAVPPAIATPPTAAQLPDIPTDATTLQLAKQVRRAAAAGQCASVERTMHAIAQRDARYHAALARMAFVASCR
jgi:hypothetical protein